MMRVFENMDVSMDVSMDVTLEIQTCSIRARFLHNRHIVLLNSNTGSYGSRGASLDSDAIANARPTVYQKKYTRQEYIGSGNGVAKGTDLDFAAAIVEICREHETLSSSSVALVDKFLHTLDNCSLLRRLNANWTERKLQGLLRGSNQQK